MTRDRGFRRHHFQRIYKKIRREIADWYKYSIMSGFITKEEANVKIDKNAKIMTNTTVCSCSSCGNQRKREGITWQERKALDEAKHQIEQMFLERIDDEWWDFYDAEREEAEFQRSEDYEYNEWNAWEGTIGDWEQYELLEVDDFDFEWAINIIDGEDKI